MTDFLLLAFVLLVAGVVAVPLASRFGLGSVLGFLIAGIALAPLLNALHVDVISLQHFAEFGVVMMLFLVGLELEPRLLWQMKTRLLGLGGLQVGLSTLLIMGVCWLLGQPWSIALAVGLVLSLSSTAIVLQTLNEKGLMKSDGGQGSFSVLLFQDIAVIPMLALIPLLALPELVELANSGASEGHGDAHAGDSHAPTTLWIETLPGWLRALVTLGAIGAVVIAGSYLTRPVFRFIAMAKLRELFVATALMMIIGIALLMTYVGLSPALGTFLAGVVLANSEYRHELESDIAPFKGLLLGLFFITVGASIDFELLFAEFGSIIALTLGLIAIKASILYGLAVVFNIGGADRWLFALGLAQAGEFGFVLLSFTVANGVIPTALSDQLLLVVALSMLLTPALFILYDKVVMPRFSRQEEEEADDIEEGGSVIIAGHGRFGGVINRMLRAAGHKTVVLDYNSSRLEGLRKFGFKIFFGDASRPDLLEAAGIEEAKLLIVAIDDTEQAINIVKHVCEHHPHVHIIARAHEREDVYKLWGAGCRDIVREVFDSAVRAGRSALEALGTHPYEAQKWSDDFVSQDRSGLREMATLYDPSITIAENEAYIARARELLQKEEQDGLRTGKPSFVNRVDRGWVKPPVGIVDELSEDQG